MDEEAEAKVRSLARLAEDVLTAIKARQFATADRDEFVVCPACGWSWWWVWSVAHSDGCPLVALREALDAIPGRAANKAGEEG